MKNEITINKKINIIKNILKLHIEIVSLRKCTLTDKQALSICNKCIRDSKKALKNIEKIKHKDIIESLYNTLVSKNETWFYFFAPLINGKNVKRWDNTKKGYKEFQELEREAQEIAKQKAKEQAEKKKKLEEAKARGDKVEMLYNPNTKKIEPIITKREDDGENA